MKKGTFAVIGLVGFGAAYLGATWWSGSFYQQTVSEQLQRISERYPAVQVVERNYQPGFFSSSEDIVLALGCRTGEYDPADGFLLPKTKIKLHSSIQHGPFLGTSGFGLVGFETEPMFDNEIKAELTKIFKDAEPLKISGKIGYSGDTMTRMRVSAAQFTPGEGEDPQVKEVSWQPLEVTLRLNDSLKNFDGRFNWPQLKIEHRDGSLMLLEGLTVSNNKKQELESLFLGQEEYGLNRLSMVLPPDGETAERGKPMKISVEKIHIASRATLDGTLVQASSHGEMERLNIDEQTFGPGKFTSDTHNIDAQSIVTLNRMFGMERILRCEPIGLNGSFFGENQQQLMSLLTALLKPDPAMNASFNLETTEGKASFGMKMQAKGITEDDVASLGALMKFDIALDLQLPEALPGKIAAQGKPREAEQIRADTQKWIDEGISKNLVVREGSFIKTHIEFKGGNLLINGKPTSLPFAPS